MPSWSGDWPWKAPKFATTALQIFIVFGDILSFAGRLRCGKLGLADRLRNGPVTPAQLAEMVGADPEALRRTMRAPAAAGVFHEADGGCFSLTPMGEYVRSDAPATLRPLVLMWGSDWVWRS